MNPYNLYHYMSYHAEAKQTAFSLFLHLYNDAEGIIKPMQFFLFLLHSSNM
jgi:hypothetical protein